jgi:cytochrome c oxidase subunit II
MFSGPSNFVESVDTAFWVVTVISVFFLVIITFLMVFFVIKYNKKRNPKAQNIHGNITLEITWTVVPTLWCLSCSGMAGLDINT